MPEVEGWGSEWGKVQMRLKIVWDDGDWNKSQERKLEERYIPAYQLRRHKHHYGRRGAGRG
jgi:hypothetical protein